MNSGISLGLHGLHVHEKPDLGNGCNNTGSHFNPQNVSLFKYCIVITYLCKEVYPQCASLARGNKEANDFNQLKYMLLLILWVSRPV